MVRFSKEDGAELLARVNDKRKKLTDAVPDSKPCGFCDAPFIPSRGRAGLKKYCSRKCSKAAQAQQTTEWQVENAGRDMNRGPGSIMECVDCGKPFPRRSPGHKHCDVCGRDMYEPRAKGANVKYTRNSCRYCGKRFTEDSFCIDRRLARDAREVKCACPQGRAGEYQLWDVAKIK